jgi:hypothetical protein
MFAFPRAAALAFLFPLLVHPDQAAASGAVFQGNGSEPAAHVTGHRMALALSPERTVLWDQIGISGAPEELAWILPVRPGATLELSSEAWLDTLDEATATQIVAPQLDCAPSPDEPVWEVSCGCPIPERTASEEDYHWNGTGQPRAARPVGVSAGQSMGPYEIVTLRAVLPGAVAAWLHDHGFAVDERVGAVFDAYAGEGYNFIILRLRPGQGVSQMKPVRVVTPGFEPTLPLRIVSAGVAERAAMTLFVITEGRWQTANMPAGVVDERDLVWDFSHDTSNYAHLRSEILDREGGAGWLTSYAQRGALLSPVNNRTTGVPLSYAIGDGVFAATIAEAFVRRALQGGETTTSSCLDAFARHADSMDPVVDVCATASMACGSAGEHEIDARELSCGGLRDLSVALTGMRPAQVWLTRIEADLPREVLSKDLTLEAAPEQAAVESWLYPPKSENAPCPTIAAGSIVSRRGDAPSRGTILAGSVIALIAAATARRAGRSKGPRAMFRR